MKEFWNDDFILLFDILHSARMDTRLPFWKLKSSDRVFLDVILRLEQHCRELGLESSASKIDDISFYDKQAPLRVGTYRQKCRELHGRLIDDLKERKFLSLTSEEAKNFWQKKDHLDADIGGKYSGALLEDLEEAGNCFAVGRYTACVFHLMRVMEAAVKIFGSYHQVAFPDDYDWGRILSAIKPAIEAMPKNTEAERTLRKRHSEVFSLLYHVKEAWRHETMHPKRTYTEEQAKEIFSAVKSYLTTLAALL